MTAERERKGMGMYVFAAVYATTIFAILFTEPDYRFQISLSHASTIAIVFALPMAAIPILGFRNRGVVFASRGLVTVGRQLTVACFAAIFLLMLLQGPDLLKVFLGANPNDLNEVSSFVGSIRAINVMLFVSCMGFFSAGLISITVGACLVLLQVLLLAKSQFVLMGLVAYLLARRSLTSTAILLVLGILAAVVIFAARNGGAEAAVRTINLYMFVSAYKSAELGGVDAINWLPAAGRFGDGIWLEYQDELFSSVPIASAIEVAARYGILGALAFWTGIGVLGLVFRKAMALIWKGNGPTDRVIEYMFLYSVLTSVLINTILYPVFWLAPALLTVLLSVVYRFLSRGPAG